MNDDEKTVVNVHNPLTNVLTPTVVLNTSDYAECDIRSMGWVLCIIIVFAIVGIAVFLGVSIK